MAKTMKDLQILLYKAKRNGNSALGEDEIFPVAFLVKKRTENKLFADVHFTTGYSGITSPEIRNTLDLFRENVSISVKDVPVPDIYFQLTQKGEEKTIPIIEGMRKENTQWEKVIEEILDNLEKDRKRTIQEAMKEIKEI